MTTTNKLLERLAATKAQISARTGGFGEKPLKLNSPKNIIRIMPSWTGDPNDVFHQDFGMHWIKSPADPTKVVAGFVCTRTTFGEDCEICDQIASAALNPANDENMVAVLKEAKASGRILVNAILRTGQHANAKTEPVIVELPATVFQNILDIAFEYLNEHEINVFDLNEGYDFTITKQGSGRNTEYTAMIAPRPSKVEGDVKPKLKDLTAWARAEHERAKARAMSTVRATFGGQALAGPARPAIAGPAKPAASKLSDARPVDLDEADDVIEGEATPVVTPSPARTMAAKPAPAAAQTDDDVLAELEGLLDS